MRHYLIVLLLIATQSIQAQISHDFRNTPLTDALRTIEQGQEEYTIVMLTDEMDQLSELPVIDPVIAGIEEIQAILRGGFKISRAGLYK